MLSKTVFVDSFLAHLPFDPTQGQRDAVDQISDFVFDNTSHHLFLLKGYAGTGKTSLVSALVNTLDDFKLKRILLAPTGRAAKVFSSYSGEKAYTIHKHIYKVENIDGLLSFYRKNNKFSHTLFLVDEVSMIANSQPNALSFSNGLLEDLVSYVFEGTGNKLLFIGDDAQLPPVHDEESPALMIDYLQSSFQLSVQTICLTEVVRQSLNSGILSNANSLRKKIEQDNVVLPVFSNNSYPDFLRINGADLEELLLTLFNRYSSDEIVLITRSNKRAIIFNNEIRKRILFREKEIAAGDFLMVIKNNYYWVDESSAVGFIANGDIIEVLSINKIEELYGFHFANITVRLCDYPDYPDIDIKIIMESLSCNEASLSREDMNRLYRQVALDYEDIANKRTRYLKIKNNPFLNAVQVKFSYSLTCHKTQGGQWKMVLVDQGYIQADNLNKEYLRWLYTAVTRATEKVYLVNFHDSFFE